MFRLCQDRVIPVAETGCTTLSASSSGISSITLSRPCPKRCWWTCSSEDFVAKPLSPDLGILRGNWRDEAESAAHPAAALHMPPLKYRLVRPLPKGAMAESPGTNHRRHQLTTNQFRSTAQWFEHRRISRIAQHRQLLLNRSAQRRQSESKRAPHATGSDILIFVAIDISGSRDITPFNRWMPCC
jgi:hypothetical protein